MMSIHDQAGGRKYLTGAEHARFLQAVDLAPRDVRAFCHTLAWTGCWVSEALALTGERVDVAAGAVTFETLKKRRRGLFRTVPIPPELATMLDLVFGLRGPAAKAPLWPFSRATAWRWVKAVLAAAGIEGAQASPKGLRHALGVAAVGQGHPAQHGAALDGPRPAHHDRDLRRGGRRGGARHRRAHVAVINAVIFRRLERRTCAARRTLHDEGTS